MRWVSLLIALIVIAVVPAWSQPLLQMPSELQVRWRCTLVAERGWFDRGYDDSRWTKPNFEIPGRYPEWAMPEDQALHSFMWHPAGANTGKPVYFRRNVSLPGEIEQAVIHLCADDQFMLYINGRGLVQSKEAHRDTELDITLSLQSGQNIIAVQAMDVQPPAYGLLVAPEITQRFPMGDGEWKWSLDGKGPWYPASYDKAPPIQLPGLDPFACLSVPGGMDEFSTAYFQRALDLDGLPVEANAVVLADDGYELYVNGTLVTLEKRAERAYIPHKADLLPFLHSGHNVIMVKVTNDWGPGRFYCVPTVTMTF